MRSRHKCQSTPAAEIDSQYLAGSQVKRVMRADRIDVKAAGSVVRRYELTYEASLSTTSRSRLASIQECGVAATNCFASTNFTYQNGVSGLSTEASTGQSIPANVFPWPLDVNGDGRQDLTYPSSNVSGSGTWMVMFASTSGGYVTPATNTGITNTNWTEAIPIDYNADGREDLLVPSTGGTWSVLISNGTTLAGPTNTFAPVVGTGAGTNARALDIDGDGYEDLVWAELYGYAGGDAIRWRRRDPAGNFEATVGTLVGPMAVDKMIMTGAFAPPGQSRRLRAPDFNGDGRGDIAYQTTRRVLNEVSGTYTFFRHVSVYCPGGTEFFAVVTAPTTPEFGDFNGDGRTDLLYTTGSPVFSFVFQYSKGTSFTSAVSGPSAATYGPQRFIITDWDSDGQDDLVAPNPSTSQWDLIRSTGEGFATTVGTGISSSVSATTVTDVNGDGLMDLGYVVSGAWRYRLHAGPQPDLLLTAADGFGLQTSFTYVPITQNNYTPTTGAVFPDQEYTGSQYVVASMTAPTGIQSPASFTTNYWYYGARRHLQGRGFLGFSSRRTIDSRNQLRVYEYASQTFPYVGMQKEVVVKQPNDTTEILHATHTLSTQTFGTGFQTRKNPYVSSSVLDRYEVAGSRDGAWVARETMSIGTIDSYGNPTSITTTAKDKDSLSPWLDETYTQVVTNTVTNDTTNWCLGQITQSTVQSTLPDATSKTRTRGAMFDAIECRPTQTSVEPSSTTLAVLTNYGFDAFGNVNSVSVVGRTPAGTAMPARGTTLNYGTRGQFPEKVTNALSEDTILTYRYDLGLRASVQDPNLLTVSWLYDDFGRATRETRIDSTYTGWAYTQCNSGNGYCGIGASDLRLQITQTQYKTDNSVVRTDYSYLDGFYRSRYGAVKNLATPSSYTYTGSEYDSLGRVSRRYVPYSTVANGSRRLTYDLIGRVTADALYNAGGTLDRQTAFGYLARYVEITDPKLNVRKRYVDVRGLERRITDPSPGGTFDFAFDHFGNLLSATDAASNVQTWTYNLLGNVTASNDPDRGSWSYASNSLGEPVTQTDAKSQTVTFAPFDVLGRPTTRTEAEGMSTWTWGRLTDNTASAKFVGRLKSIAGPSYSETYTYDSLGRPSHTTFAADTGYDVDYAYDATSGMLDNVTYPASTGGTALRAQYLYQYGMLQRVRDYNTPTTVWWQLNAIDDLFNPIEEQLSNGVRILSNMDPLTGLMNWRTSGTNASLYNNQQNLSFAWDLNGNLKDRIDGNQSNLTEHFEYDALDRLDYSTLNGVTNLDVSLDAIGNITNRSDVGAYTYHATKKHAVATAGAWSFTYDNNGNMLTGRGATATWTSFNLPASITNGAVSSQFSYTPTRAYWRQIAQYPSGSETTIYIGGLFEKVTRGTFTDYRHMIRAGSATIVVTRSTGSNNQTYYVTQDPLGSSSVVTNSSGAVVVNESFAAYGNRRGSNWTGAPTSGDMTAIADSTRRGFTGHTMLDNLALVHMNGRVYDPLIGRFMSADPFVDSGAGTQGLNRYSYVGNNPLSFVDPSGYSLGTVIRSIIDGLARLINFVARGIGFVHNFGMGNSNGGSPADRLGNDGSNGNNGSGPSGSFVWGGIGAASSGQQDLSDAGHGSTAGRKAVKPQIIPATGVQCDMTPCRSVAGASSTVSGTDYQGTWGDFALSLGRVAADETLRTLVMAGAVGSLYRGDFRNAYFYLRVGLSAKGAFGAPDSNRGQFGYDVGPVLTTAVVGGAGLVRGAASSGERILYRIVTSPEGQAFLSNAAKRLGPRGPEIANALLHRGISVFDSLEGAASRVPILQRGGHNVLGIAELRIPAGAADVDVVKTLGRGHYTLTGSPEAIQSYWFLSWLR